MKIAIQAADLDAERIDGTRVYILNLLKNFGKLSEEDDFLIYHKGIFNPELAPPDFSNYEMIKKPFPFVWSQTRFAWEIFRKKPDVLWMPMQGLPIFRRKNLRTVVTIHDLAFKYFPDFFPKKDLRKLNFLTDYAVRQAERLIAVSHSTKRDILENYPEIDAKKIRVIHHGFDPELFEKRLSEEALLENLKKFGLEKDRYLLYVGALQPRKNLDILVEAFPAIRKEFPGMKLVLAGEKAWLWKGLLEKVEQSPEKEAIVLPGKIAFQDLPALYQGASAFVFPSLYEGFGIPILEAFASETPVISAKNSSLPEVGGEAAIYFDEKDPADLVRKATNLLRSREKKEELVRKGKERLSRFSWERCAEETLEFMKD